MYHLATLLANFHALNADMYVINLVAGAIYNNTIQPINLLRLA